MPVPNDPTALRPVRVRFTADIVTKTEEVLNRWHQRCGARSRGELLDRLVRFLEKQNLNPKEL